MAAGVKTAGFAAMLRVLVVTLGTHASDWRPAVAVLAAASMVVGAWVAVLQTDVKRMLAYSSIAHAGFILLGVQAASERGTAAVYVYLFVYTLLATGSFAVITTVAGRGDAAHGLDAYRGLARRQPVLAGAFTVLLLGQAGVPFTGGFVAKLGVLVAAVEGRTYWVAMVAMAAAAVAAFVYLRILVAMYLEDPEPDTDDRSEVPTGTRLVIGVACAGVLLIGLVPGFLLDIASDAVPVLVGG
jgi:NADH-quinone oxidoreductase subunit N